MRACLLPSSIGSSACRCFNIDNSLGLYGSLCVNDIGLWSESGEPGLIRKGVARLERKRDQIVTIALISTLLVHSMGTRCPSWIASCAWALMRVDLT
jgi:hypothetical protein